MSGLRLFLLGAPYLERSGASLHIDSRKALATLAYLAVSNQGHRTQGLATLLWPEADPADALSELDRSLDMIEMVLGPKTLDVAPETVAIARRTGEPGALWLDVGHFYRLLEACGTHGHSVDEVCPECIPLLSEAVDLYRGDFMAGFELPGSAAFEDWRLFEQDVLRREMTQALGRLVRGHSARAEFETAIVFARRRLQLDPWHEPTHRQLMSLFAWTGDLAAAHDQYQQCARLLQSELGQSPEPITRELHEQIQAGQLPSPTSWAKAAPDEASGCATQSPVFEQVVHSLAQGSENGHPPTPFVNREEELVEIERLLLSDPPCRLLTLVGPGGIGKTRLAMQVAERVGDGFADGVHVVSLSGVEPIGDPAAWLVTAIAEALGLSAQGGLWSDGREPRTLLLDHLRARNVLLMLDGMDRRRMPHGFVGPHEAVRQHLVLTERDVVADIWRTAPKVTLLVTSRESLGLDGERVWSVGGLSHTDVPPSDGAPADDSAVKLFLESVHRLTASYPLSEADRRAAVRICRLLEGIPLGLELASAWAGVMSLTQIAADIERSLASWSALRDVPPGYRVLRAVLERSWALLSEDEQSILVRLSVFRGGFDRGAARFVAGASPFLLMALAGTALIRLRVPPGAQVRQAERYELHELVRQFVADKGLHGMPAIERGARDVHCAYYTTFLHEREERLRGAEQRAAADEIAAEIDNVRAAWQWAVASCKTIEVDRSLEALYLFYYARGWMQEGLAAFQSAAGALQGAAVQGERGGDTQGVEYVVGRLLARQARFAHRLGQHQQARELLEESRAVLDRFEGAGRDAGSVHVVPRQERAFGLFALSAVLRAVGESAEARQALQEGLALYRESGDRAGMAMTLKLLGIVHGSVGDLEAAQQRLQEALALYQEIVDPYGTASTLNDLSIVAARQGKVPEAQRLNRECLAIRRQIGDRWGVATSLNNLGYVAYLSESYGEAVEYLREGLAIQREIGDRYHIANCLSNLGAAAHALGEREEALAHLYEGLEIAYAIGARPLVLEISAEIGALLASAAVATEDDAQAAAQAAELLTFVHDHPQVDKWTAERTEQSLAQLAPMLAPEAWAAAQDKGRRGTLEAVIASILRRDLAPDSCTADSCAADSCAA